MIILRSAMITFRVPSANCGLSTLGGPNRERLRTVRCPLRVPLQPGMWGVFLRQMAEASGVTKAALLAHDFETGDHSITDNVTGSRQTVSLTASGEYVTLSSSSSGLSISSADGAATGTIQIAPVDGFTGAVNLTCTVAYQGQGTASDPPTCALSPAQTQISGTTPVSSTLTVSTTAATASAVHDEIFKGAGVSLAALLCFGLLPRRRWRRSMLLIALGVAATAGFIGCGSSPSGSSAPPSNPARRLAVM